ncbi:nucleotidyltransferase [Halosquirtibacter xylanolyticus]|uniref:nucleotidyltransferase family protein n=1 Tax=Halosquirtibacter xylanolyticus TaxID=3374599 RepID=UPI00374A165C|nr:nucleotidyltransferase [Prolixibacteraceae bacterium]
MKPTLLILAAGMGSRYGGLKQLDAFGPSGETILEYSIYDAIRAGFGKVVFVIRKSFAEEFKSKFASKLEGKIEVDYVFQELDNLPEGYSLPEGREKPWGTGHAVLVAKDAIKEPFAIINADDFYGKDAFVALSQYLSSCTKQSEYCMVGYHLHKTLSDFGSVSRGVCKTDENDMLVEITERTKIVGEEDGIYYYEGEEKNLLDPKTAVSMNCWAFMPGFFDYLQKGFVSFLGRAGEEMKSEYFFPFEVSDQLKSDNITVKVLDSDADWFGVTYPEDKPEVQSKLNKLIKRGDYPEDLWV